LENFTGKRPLGRLKHRQEDIFKINITKIGYEDVNWTELVRS
jgi:hypothetical protein